MFCATAAWACGVLAAPDGLDPPGLCRAVQGVEHGHVPDRVLERDRAGLAPAPSCRPGEELDEDRVLIDGVEVDGLGVGALDRTAGLDHHLRRRVAGRVPGVDEGDVPLRAEQARPLDGGQLHASGEDRLPFGEPEHGARQPVDAGLRIAIADGERCLGLGVEAEAAHGHGVETGVVEDAAPHAGGVADVRARGDVVAERAGEAAQRADLPLAHQLPYRQPARVDAHHRRLADQHPVAIARLEQPAGLGGVGQSDGVGQPAGRERLVGHHHGRFKPGQFRVAAVRVGGGGVG